MNNYIVYDINKNFSMSNYSTIESFLFGVVSLTKNADIDKYKSSGYGIGLNKHGFFHILVVEVAEM